MAGACVREDFGYAMPGFVRERRSIRYASAIPLKLRSRATHKKLFAWPEMKADERSERTFMRASNSTGIQSQ